MDKNISFTLKVWRQAGPKAKGAFETYQMKDIPGDTSFLEMLDILNEQLISERKEPVVFDHDCREGICGMCSLYINGHPHGPATCATTCQIYMRRFNDGDTITVEPAFGRFPCYQGLNGRPYRLRQNHAGRWLRERSYRCSAGCQRYPDSEAHR